jgi:hypothetical protein
MDASIKIVVTLVPGLQKYDPMVSDTEADDAQQYLIQKCLPKVCGFEKHSCRCHIVYLRMSAAWTVNRIECHWWQASRY